IPAQKIEQAVGPSLSIPQVNKIGWKLLSKLHNHPSISSLNWLSVKRGELDLTLNKDCITHDVTDFRLIRGSNISRYSLNDRTGTKPEFVDIEQFRKKLGVSSRAAHISQNRIACQQVSNRNQRWRLKFASIPTKVVLANSCNYLIDHEHSDKYHRLLFLGILNSELMNWRFSLTNTNNHVSTRELTQLPLPDLETSSSQNISSQIVEEVKGIKSSDTTPKIEALVFALYGFSVSEAKAILKMRSTPEKETSVILLRLGSFLN
ncbi:MAG: TaqI-like C-terminal specificity domain-containing protein, partial [Candidatus Thorarchaeota archaeon]